MNETISRIELSIPERINQECIVQFYVAMMYSNYRSAFL